MEIQRVFSARRSFARGVGFAVGLALTLVFCGAPDAWAQLNMLDQQAEAPVGPTGAGREGLNRARQVGNDAAAIESGEGAPAARVDEAGGAGRQQADPMANMPRFAVRRFPAIEGQRIYDAVSYRRNPNAAIVLDDPRRIEITEDQQAEFADDGRTLGDVDANDGLYSKILPENTDQYIGGGTNYSLLRMITVLKAAQELDPLDFFNVSALTTERFSAVPKLRDKIQEKNGKIYVVDDKGAFSGWSDVFLKDYRVERENPSSKFFQLYVPRPPSLPAIKPPVAPWLPFTHEVMRMSEEEMKQLQGSGGPGGGMGGEDGVGGRPVGDGYFGSNTEIFFNK